MLGAHAASVVGVSATMTLAAAATMYTRRTRRLRRDVLTLTRVAADTLPPSLSSALPRHLALLNICRFMALDGATAQLGPWQDCNMLSMPDYLRTLRIPGDFNWRTAILTLLVHNKKGFLLPVAASVVKESDRAEHVDIMGPLGGSPLVFAILRDAFSPLHLYAISANPT
jgi:hypothetical protein